MNADKKTLDQIKSKLTLVSPELAESWIGKNTNNRGLRAQAVTKMASDMEAGQWYLTHQGIAFNCDGTLLDGQHRLHAIIKSQTSQWMLVTTGLPKESMTAVDVDINVRTIADAISIGHGRSMTGKGRMVSAAEWVYTGAGPFNSRRSKQEKIAFFLKHEAALQWAADTLNSSLRGLGRAAILGVVARAYYTADRERVARFCKVLSEGIPDAPAERTIVKLRDFLMSDTGAGGWSSMSTTYKKTARALEAFLADEVLSRIYECNDEPFPLLSDAS